MLKHQKKHGKQKVEPEDMPLIVELLETMSTAEVAKKWEVTVGTISHNLAIRGLPNTDEIKKQYRYKYYLHHKQLGKTYAEIARELYISYTALHKMVSKIKKENL